MATRAPLLRILIVVLMAALMLPTTPAGAAAPEDATVLYEVLSDGANEPMSMEIAPDGRIIWGQRDGLVFVNTPDGLQTLAGRIPTAGNLCELCEPDAEYIAENTPPNRALGYGGLEEGGLYGMLLDDDFAETNRMFIYRSIPGSREQVHDRFEGRFAVSSFVLDPATNLIDLASEEEILSVPAEWDWCCHYGGDLDYLPDGTIVMTTGDDVMAEASDGYGPRDRTGLHANAERTSANPADRRGKILRFREDGSVPDGSIPGEVPNPFIGMEGYNPYLEEYPDDYDPDGDGWIPFDPYVYSLGWKQPWRSVVHPSGLMYTSEVGPDSSGVDADYNDPANTSDENYYGPPGYEEVNAVPFGGGTHAGWPRCTGPNYPYRDIEWSSVPNPGVGLTNTAVELRGLLDCGADVPVARPIGSTDESTWIRGMDPAVYYYPSAESNTWPAEVIGTGGKTSEPVAYYPAETEGTLRLPAAYDDRLLLLEWSRKYILTIPSDPETGVLDLDPAGMWQVPMTSAGPAPDPARPLAVSNALTGLQAPIDGKVNPVDGAFYFLEYGSFFYAGETGRLARIRNADATPIPGQNYGLPIATAQELTALDTDVASVVPVSLRTTLLVGLGLGLAAIHRRRRRSIA